jgi:hypothetical protein
MSDDATRYMWYTAGLILAALAITLAFTLESYRHERPAVECKPYIYPICMRAQAPTPLAPPSAISMYLSIIGTAVLVIILVYASFHATVTEQAHIVTPTSGTVSAAPKTDSPTTILPPRSNPSTGVDLKLVQL